MPSFLADENSPIYANHDIVNLDPNNRFGLADGKGVDSNAGAIRQHRSEAFNETFDESSATSTHDSEVSDTVPMAARTNGNGTRPTSLDSLPNGNGHAALRHDSPKEEYFSGNVHRPFANGSMTMDLPDRTLPSRVSDVETNGSDVTPRNSTGTQLRDATGASSTSSRLNHERLAKNSLDSSTSLTPTSPSVATDGRQARMQSLGPSSPTADNSTAQRIAVHRLSSPPVYNSSAHSASGHLQPPVSPVLKQRHTLEVPKVPQSRLPKEPMDAATASGRFSPTHATPSHRRGSLNLARRATRSMQSDAPRDEVIPDEDAARWAEAYRQKRASKRKRKEEEDDDRVLVGTKVDESHANWVTAYNMLTGIRVSVSRTNAKLDRELTDADFEAKQKSTFDM